MFILLNVYYENRVISVGPTCPAKRSYSLCDQLLLLSWTLGGAAAAASGDRPTVDILIEEVAGCSVVSVTVVKMPFNVRGVAI